MLHFTGLPALEQQAINAIINNTTLLIRGQMKSVQLMLTQTAQENLIH